jgi:nicotinate phosphoribosyltransferase
VKSGLDTDLYELTMAAGYWRAGLTRPATFELFVRRLPSSRGYLIAAGLETALAHLEGLGFSEDDRNWLRHLPQFANVPPDFFDEYLARFAFSGDVWAMPEGTTVFANEPLLRVTASLPDAQLLETALLAIVSFQTSVASKAARLVDAAAGRPVIEFGARRAHGLGGALDAARAAYIGGCDGTSFVTAARRFDIPTSGTMAHAWVQSFPTERAAFSEFSRTFEESAVYLLDTYDTLNAARALAQSGLEPPVVRLDSGDLIRLSREVRKILDDAGLAKTRIFATGDLDEHEIARMIAAGAAIDGFGVGTALTTVSDAPSLSAVYKLVELERDGQPVDVVKLSPGKHTWPGAKQVWRCMKGPTASWDVIAGCQEAGPPQSGALLRHVLARGKRICAPETLGDIRARCRATMTSLPAAVTRIADAAPFDVRVSEALETRRLAAERRST